MKKNLHYKLLNAIPIYWVVAIILMGVVCYAGDITFDKMNMLMLTVILYKVAQLDQKFDQLTEEE